MAEINSKLEQLFNAFSNNTTSSSSLSPSPLMTTINNQNCLPTITTSSMNPMSLSSSQTAAAEAMTMMKLYTNQQQTHNDNNNRQRQLMHQYNNNNNNDPLSLIDQNHYSQFKPTLINEQNFNNMTITSSSNDISSLLPPLTTTPLNLLQQPQCFIGGESSTSTTYDRAATTPATTATTTQKIQPSSDSSFSSDLFSLFNVNKINNNNLQQSQTLPMMPDLLSSMQILNINNRNFPTMPTNIENNNLVKKDIDNICSSLSSSSSDGGGSINQDLTPASLVNDIVHETVIFEHTEDFIKSLQIPLEVLDDLASRFILNMPQEEKYDRIRICFQMELAYWHYLDFCCQCDSKLPKFKFRRFAQIMFTYVPRLRQFLDVLDETVTKWIQYKFSIPCSGAIMLDETMDFILLVQGYGSKNWGFPKGKVNHDESLMDCCIREVFEETGYKCIDNIFETQYLERKIFESRLRLYLIKNVDFNFDFKPQARNEIRSIKWFALKEFPTSATSSSFQQDQRHNKQQVMAASANDSSVLMPHNASKFCSVIPFINAIRKWVENEKRKMKLAKKKERRQQNMILKKEKRKSSESKNGERRILIDENITMNHPGSNSSSPSTVEDENIAIINGDNAGKAIKESTSFVDVDLNEILGFREMYNVKNDDRQLLTRQQIHDNACLEADKKNFQTTWDNLVQDYNANNDLKNKTFNNFNGFGGGIGDFIKNSFEYVNNSSPLPQAGNLEDIERAMIDSAQQLKNDQQSSDNNLQTMLGSKGSCNEKLNLLFGLAQTSTTPATNTASTVSTTSFSLIPKNGFEMISNANNAIVNNNVVPIESKPQKPSSPLSLQQQEPTPTKIMDPIGTPRNNNQKSVNSNNNVNNRQQSSGHQTVISNNNNANKNSNNHGNNKRAPRFKSKLVKNNNQAVDTPTPKTAIVEKNKNYNAINEETLNIVQPKIELLLQRLTTINNMA